MAEFVAWLTSVVPEWVFWVIAIAILLVVAYGWSLSMEDAMRRRRAWNLWEAGIIDDAELRRRVDG